MIGRILSDNIKKDFFQGKIIVVLGPRQVGKTTLMNQLQLDPSVTLSLNCDDPIDAASIENVSSTDLHSLIDGFRYVVIDEAQRVKNIGLTLKMIADIFKDSIQVLVTGSSSFDLTDEINEPATGRLYEYYLFPVSLPELATQTQWREVQKQLSARLIYGSYPEVINRPGQAERILKELADNYLYKDLLSYKGMRKPDVLMRLLQALSLQVGSEVSFNEISRLVGIDKVTVENYITLLEKCFIIFRLPSFSRNMRTEIRKGKKVYFYDNGIRNAIIRNFAPMELRTDGGLLWENLIISERVKRNAYANHFANLYFWRTQEQQEIDLIEEINGTLTAYEFKRNKTKAALPQAFRKSYGDIDFQVITPENMKSFLAI